MNGLLGSYTILKGIPQSIYIGNTNEGAVVTLNICNRNNKSTNIRVAITDSMHSPTSSEYIEYDVEILAKGVLERSGVVVGLNQYLTVYSSESNVTATCWGAAVGDPQTVTPVTTNTDLIAPVWNTSASFDVYAGNLTNLQLSATDASSVTYSLTSGTLPSGLSLGDNGQLFGTPVSTGYNVSGVTTSATITASDGTNNTARTFSITRKWYDGSSSTLAAPSASYIKSITGTTTNGSYWIKSDTGAVQTYCLMASIDGGGWTLIGKSGGGSWHDPNGWLKSSVGTMTSIASPGTNGYACIDARLVAGEYSNDIMISSFSLTYWVKVPIHSKATKSTIFNHAAGQSAIYADALVNSEIVNAVAWNNGTTLSYVNKYMVMGVNGHGGSTPAWTFNADGNTNVSDYAMAVACANDVHNGFQSPGNGRDAPYNSNDTGWPNDSYNSGHFYGLVWTR